MDTMTKERFLTVRWNNLLALGLGIPSLGSRPRSARANRRRLGQQRCLSAKALMLAPRGASAFPLGDKYV
jgi:hypothetical protein